jgi:hypothetical protein
MVWLPPAAHWKVHGAVQALPSTISDNPTGADVTVTEILGFKVTIAVPNLVASATLIACTVTVIWEVIEAGAVYTPEAEIVPGPPFGRLQTTAVFANPVMVAVNCCV